MGIIDHTFDILKPYLDDCNDMLELGCQEFMLSDGIRPAKPYFESLGINHISIDLEECFGALKIDLTEDLNFRNDFDIVTNFGTSEHCMKQYPVFLNMHKACRVGGYLFNWVPKVDNWPEHGYYTYRPTFFEFLSNMFGYSIVLSGETATCNNTIDGWTLYAIMQKTSESTRPVNYITNDEGEYLMAEHLKRDKK